MKLLQIFHPDSVSAVVGALPQTVVDHESVVSAPLGYPEGTRQHKRDVGENVEIVQTSGEKFRIETHY